MEVVNLSLYDKNLYGNKTFTGEQWGLDGMFKALSQSPLYVWVAYVRKTLHEEDGKVLMDNAGFC